MTLARRTAAECVGTAFLLAAVVGSGIMGERIWGCARLHSSTVPFAVGAYITGSYWFTASTSFTNPAVTLTAKRCRVRSFPF
jgi:glycerol uptake facilitator-like aquaporin